MSVYLSVAQAQNIVFELMEIVPKGVSVTDENGIIIASSNASLLGKNSKLAAECIEQASQMISYNERHYSGNRTATPIFFRNICVGAIIMAGDVERIKRITSIARRIRIAVCLHIGRWRSRTVRWNVIRHVNRLIIT